MPKLRETINTRCTGPVGPTPASVRRGCRAGRQPEEFATFPSTVRRAYGRRFLPRVSRCVVAFEVRGGIHPLVQDADHLDRSRPHPVVEDVYRIMDTRGAACVSQVEAAQPGSEQAAISRHGTCRVRLIQS
jgi:hypothetical protein